MPRKADARQPAKGKVAARRKRKTTKTGKAGRPKVTFDLDEIEGYGRILATRLEMAHALGVASSVIDDRFANDADFRGAYEKGAADGKIGLRRRQLQAALEGNSTMMIWLGKQLLGQKDTQHHEVSLTLQRQLAQQDARLIDTVWAAVDRAQREFEPEVFDRVDEFVGWMIEGFKAERQRQQKLLGGDNVVDVTPST